MTDDEWFTSNARHVRFEPLFDEQIKGLGFDAEWFDDAMVGLDIALAKRPETFPQGSRHSGIMREVSSLQNCSSTAGVLHLRRDAVKLICVEFVE